MSIWHRVHFWRMVQIGVVKICGRIFCEPGPRSRLVKPPSRTLNHPKVPGMLTVPKTRELKGRDGRSRRGRSDPVAFVIKESNSLDTKLNTPDKMLSVLVDPIQWLYVNQGPWETILFYYQIYHQTNN